MSRPWRRFLSACASMVAAGGPYTAAAPPHPLGINFPGSGVSELRSRTGVTVYYTDPGADADGIDERPIRLRYPDGRSEQIDTFIRNADLSWSPHGDYLTLTNWIGSNIADCLAITPRTSRARKQSLTSLIDHHLPAVARDMDRGDHVYVSCGGWISPARVQVKVYGYGCDPAPCTPRVFKHDLVYDFRSGRLTLADRGASTKRKG